MCYNRAYMKSLQKGFIVPLLLIIVAVLVVGGGYYMYSLTSPSSTTQVPAMTDTPVSPNTSVSQTEDSINDGEKTPRIDSISPAKVETSGTFITIKGAYLNGFEGGTIVRFEKISSESGLVVQSGFMEANSYTPKGATTLTFTLPNQLCTKITGESGLPCPSYMGMTPGAYKVSVRPWSIFSNKLDFVVRI